MIPPARSRSPPPSGGANKPGPPSEGLPLIPARSLALATASDGTWPRSVPPAARSQSSDCLGFTPHQKCAIARPTWCWSVRACSTSPPLSGWVTDSLRRLARHSSYRATSTVVRQRGFEPPTSAPVIADCGGIRTRCCIHRTAGGGALRPHSSAATSRCTRHVVATPPRAATAADT